MLVVGWDCTLSVQCTVIKREVSRDTFRRLTAPESQSATTKKTCSGLPNVSQQRGRAARDVMHAGRWGETTHDVMLFSAGQT